MKIYAQIVSYFPNKASFRGAFLLDQTRALESNQNNRVLVFKIVNTFSKERDYTYENIEVKIVKSLKLPSNIFPYLFQGINTFLFNRKLRKLGLEKKHIRVAHCHDMHNCIYGSWLKKNNPSTKFFVQVHGLDVLEINNGKFQNKLNTHHIIENAAANCSNADTIIGVSKLTVQQFKKYSQFDKSNYTVLYNGVDASKFYSTNSKPSAQLVIGCIANFNPIKDHLTLVKALDLIKSQIEFKCILVGTGPTLESIKSFVAEHQLEKKVEFVESINHNDLVDFYNSIDLFVMPSYYESLGCVYLEAHACGVPFVSVRGMGINELIHVEDRPYWTIEPGDDRRLAEIIFRFYNDRNGFQLSREIDIDKCVRTFLTDSGVTE